MVQFAQKTDLDENDLMKSKEVSRTMKRLPWYLFHSDSRRMHFFKSFLGLLTLVQFFELAFIVSLDEAIEIPLSTFNKVLMLVTEILFAIHFIINFFTVPSNMKEPDLTKTAKEYLKGYFILDFITTIISNVLFLIPGYGPKLWRIRLKTSRIFHIRYIRFAVAGIVE